MKDMGIVRQLDMLGRITIPQVYKELHKNDWKKL